jgi:hypothetical protein
VAAGVGVIAMTLAVLTDLAPIMILLGLILFCDALHPFDGFHEQR